MPEIVDPTASGALAVLTSAAGESSDAPGTGDQGEGDSPTDKTSARTRVDAPAG
jgi:hypothetical protein